MPDNYHVTIIRPPGNHFPSCFVEMSKLVQWGLRELGHECTRRENHLNEDATNVVFGWHEWWQEQNPLAVMDDHHVILYQGEQICPGGRAMPDWYVKSLMKAQDVWDYSMDNVTFCSANGLESKWVPPAWHPKSHTIDRDGLDQDIDVLFMGAINPRREYILANLERICKIQVLTQTWGEERDEFIARSKILINVHYYPSSTLELMRIAHCLANEVPVISEVSNWNPYDEGIRCSVYSQLIGTVVKALQDPEGTRELGQQGHEMFKAQKSMVEILEEAISPAADSADEPVTEPVG